MAAQGGEAAAGSDAKPTVGTGMEHPNSSPYQPSASDRYLWSSSTGASWNYSVDNSNQTNVYYDPQRDVSVSGSTENVASGAAHVVPSGMGTTNPTDSYAPYANSVQPCYSAAQYPNYYYNYPQTANESSVQQGVDQSSGAAYQPLTSFQNSGSYVDPTSNTYYNAGAHQTAPGYATNNNYYQSSSWTGGSSGDNHAQSYQGYTPADTNAAQSSSSLTNNSYHYQQQYNQWPYYYDQSAPNSGGPAVAVSSNSNANTANISSGYVYPSTQPPPPGTTPWKSDAGVPAVPPPPPQAPGIPVCQNQHVNQAAGPPGYQNQYVNQAPGTPGFQNQYASQAPAVPGYQNQYANLAPTYQPGTAYYSQLPLSNQADQQKASHWQDARRVNKIQIPTNPRIAPIVAMTMPKAEKRNSEADASQKPAYVSVAVQKNDVKAAQDGHEAVTQGSIPASLRTYVGRNLSRCKDDVQRSAVQSILKEMITKATADGILHTKNWDIEPLIPLLENVTSTNLTSSAKDLNPFSFSTSRRSPNRRVKSRWEPVVEEKVANKVEVTSKESAKSNTYNSSEMTKRAGSSWDLGKFLHSRQAPLSQYNQRPSKKKRIGGNSSLTENGNVSSDSDKEQDLTKYYANAITIANSPEEKKRREHRSKRFERSHGAASSKSRSSAPNKEGPSNIYARRSISMLLNRSNGDGVSFAVEDLDWDALTVKGTCQEIEKRYLRLTSAPDPATVRPEDVLEKALHMVETSQKNYLYKCDQLKSIRQDLTVQRIQNELTVKVYETHARLALQAGDLPEFNQCQSQLKRLYAEGIKGCHLEFSAYNLLCVMLHSNNKRDLLSSMASLSKDAKQDRTVKHALAVHSAVSSGNYVLFFKLYKTAPDLNSCLMDLYVERMRFEALKCISKSYRPTLPVKYAAQVLGFMGIDEVCEATKTDGLEECEEWLKAHGAVLSVDSNNGELQIDTKVSSTSLYMPEPDNAVSHGDASLAVNDFLARAS
ncbi:SAC3 family protein A isoform X2 [Oryza brachyantha]|uniref:SAC3 family protein A isoform X2 n=1 Tax=Oryza brachyantha TaxID=4533 RepID=UPI000776A941|nr:SAC3 family protein A isoform X2 [Oryza brachyantha]